MDGKEKAVSLHSQNNGNGVEEKEGGCCSASSLNEWSKQSLKGKSTRVHKKEKPYQFKQINPKSTE